MSDARRSCGENDLPFDNVEILPGPAEMIRSTPILSL